jgi:VWFA-related protein
MLVIKNFTLNLRTLFVVISMAQSIVTGQSGEKPTASEQGEDVVRVNTELVQTDVTVFDKRGRFVEGLRQQDFELRIDGKARPISLFDRVVAGSRTEESQLAAARGGSRSPSTIGAPVPLDRGRIVFFFVDDLHMAPANLNAARKVLSHYLDHEMGQNDQAAITSASGQIGFLQQITDNKDVLHAALARVKARPPLVGDAERPHMSEYQALSVERNNRDVIGYFVDELMKDMPSLPPMAAARIGGLPRTRAEQQVRDRAQLILQQAAAVTTSVLAGLESLVRSAAKLPGRKLVFFVSDGFLLDLHNSDSLERLRQITSAAAHSGVVIYSVDARGLVTGLPDASSDAAPDPGGRLQRMAAGELNESRDGMNALAADTGGRGIFNTNSLDAGIDKALDETSSYYLLAWRPDNEEQRSDRFRMISVSVIGRPELTVRVRQGFFSVDRQPAKATKLDEQRSVNGEKIGDSQLHSAMIAAIPESGLPISLSLTYVNTPGKGLVLTVALQVKSGALSFTPFGGKERATLEIAGFVLDDEGRIGARFNEHLNIDRPASTSTGARDVIYSYPVTIPPGLYQVRVGLRDQTSKAIGTGQDWIDIPDISKTPLALSSLIISERLPAATEPADVTAVEQAGFSIDHRFHRNSFLRFLSFIYSAQPAAKPDIVVQLQIMRDNQPVLTTSLRKVNTEGIPDLTRLAYAAEISLEHLPGGRYVLQVTALDRATRQTAVQRTRFQIE